MKRLYYLVLLILAILFTGCGVQKKAVQETPVAIEEPEEPAWHTCLIQGARATARINNDKYSVNVSMQVVRDSMLVISVTPLFGIEIMRLEATPFELIGIDKLHGQYVRTTFAELNRKLTPSINWDVLQQLCSAELPGSEQQARLVYTFGDDIVELQMLYPASRQLDVPVRVTNQPLIRYQQVDVSKWL